jgi:hypothetical protein
VYSHLGERYVGLSSEGRLLDDSWYWRRSSAPREQLDLSHEKHRI